MIFYFRIFTDLLWQIKPLSVFTNLALFFLVLRIVLKNKIYIVKSGKIVIYLMGGLFLLFTSSFLQNQDFDTVVIYIKVAFSLLMFCYGIMYRGNIYDQIERLSRLSIIFIFFYLLLSFLAIGYQSWGNVRTFTGFYYFKTDMALAVVIFLSFAVLKKSLNKYLRVLLILVSFYLVYKTNARIHLLSIFLVVGLAMYSKTIFSNFGKKLVTLIPVALVLFIGLVLTVNSFGGSNELKIDIFSKDAFSESNLQGRNEIWDVILDGYKKASLSRELFGMGLEADREIATRGLDVDAEHNAHNGYLYLLVATGAIGLGFFLMIIYYLFKRFFILTRYYTNLKDLESKNKLYILLNIFLINLFVFLISNLTNANIIFQNQTWFFMFFSGILFNRNYFPSKKLTPTLLREKTSLSTI